MSGSGSSKHGGSIKKEGAAYTIAAECERLFCASLRDAFGTTGQPADERSMDMHSFKRTEFSAVSGEPMSEPSSYGSGNGFGQGQTYAQSVIGSANQPVVSTDSRPDVAIDQYFELYDYEGGAKFRGFTASNKGQRSLFVFFENDIIECELKFGIMALLELCDVPDFACTQAVICVDRTLNEKEAKILHRDLGWVGFEPYTLVDWARSDEIISDRWLFVNLET